MGNEEQKEAEPVPIEGNPVITTPHISAEMSGVDLKEAVLPQDEGTLQTGVGKIEHRVPIPSLEGDQSNTQSTADWEGKDNSSSFHNNGEPFTGGIGPTNVDIGNRTQLASNKLLNNIIAIQGNNTETQLSNSV